MKNLSEVSQKMILAILAIAGIICLGGLIFYRSIEAFYFANGVILASALNVAKVFMLENMVKKLGVSEDSFKMSSVYLQYILRFVLTAVVLLIGVFVPFISLFGIVGGVLTLPLSGFAMKFFPDAQ